MVYTYNQGVILSGLRLLWEATANATYLEDGHELTMNVIKATGWRSDDHAEVSLNGEWAGLGRDGVVEDHCDAAGDCSQDAQTFKSIFFHHLALFCEPLHLLPSVSGKTAAVHKTVARQHTSECRAYLPWVAHNARAALRTRDPRRKIWYVVGSERNRC